MALLDRAKYVIDGESGASNLEIIVWMSVVLVIAGFLFAFRNKIADFLNNVTGKVGSMNDTLTNKFDAGNNGLATPGGGAAGGGTPVGP